MEFGFELDHGASSNNLPVGELSILKLQFGDSQLVDIRSDVPINDMFGSSFPTGQSCSGSTVIPSDKRADATIRQ